MLNGPNRKFVWLSTDRGDLPTAGKQWEALTGQTMPESGFMMQKAERQGYVEYIKMRGGKKGITLRLNNGVSRNWECSITRN